ncbi:MAG: protein-glutamate O-methyltransferase CheR [Spirochaetales bacterium]|nr:protein-glutamate O-methyltransferase CheR [Spirochaetales bacterium]
MGYFLSEDDFNRYSKLIYDESGIFFSDSNRTILESRLKERLRKAGSDTVQEYYRVLRENKEELKDFLDSVTTNLTRFFRNTSHFQTLEYYVFPHLIEYKKQKGENTLRIWSAGCSTGEEPYSIAMVARNLVPPQMKVEIVASDLSLRALMTAKEGFYPEAKLKGVPDVYLRKYFLQKGEGYNVTENIKNMVTFDYHNLKFPSGLQKLDIVFCRNVIIYFDEAAQKAVIEKFWETMGRHSFLFIGHSESLFGMNTQFEFLKTDWACIYRKFLE